MKKNNKLVRDKIPGILGECKYHVASTEEFEEALYDKFQDELVKFVGNPNVNDFVEMLEIMDTIRKFYSLDIDEIKKIKVHKKRNDGGFNERIIIEK